jgi:hypothetical protein
MIKLDQMKRAIVTLLSLGSVIVGAQQPAPPEKAPPAVESALKARVVAFWEAQMAKKYRLADQYVVEEAKDEYFGADKPECRSWGYSHSLFQENFTKAQVFVNCETQFSYMGPPVWIKRPVMSFWVLKDGLWFWTAPPKRTEIQTPFGVMKVTEREPADGKAPAAGVGAFKAPASVAEMMGNVIVSRKSIEMKAFAKSSEEFTVTNRTGVGIALAADAPILAGFHVRFEKASLDNGESTKVTLTYPGAPGRVPPTPLTIPLHVDPFAQDISIEVRFKQ